VLVKERRHAEVAQDLMEPQDLMDQEPT